ncbi:MAG: ABC transporter permease [Deltaproteobacteria bacterium]|nr:ABC transporter permease [Deltaproteobacteria bacterium]
MLLFILRRLFLTIPTALGVVTVVSLMIHAIPGDPVDSLLGEFASLEEKQLLSQQLGLDLPIWQQFLKYLSGVCRGDLQNSLIYHKPVSSLIAQRIFPTVELAILAIITAILISIPSGIMSALCKGKKSDLMIMTFSMLGVAVPNFWLGPMLILIFSLTLGWLPVSDRSGLSSYILPVLTLGTSLAAILSRMTRNSVLECLKEDYIRTAKAKGQRHVLIMAVHVMGNAALPLISVIGLQFGVLLTGAVITEKIFDWPGLGSLMLDGLGQRDYPLVQGCVLFFSFSYLLVNLLTDLAYAYIDPRISLYRSEDS